MSDDEPKQGLLLSVIWTDEDLLELACLVSEQDFYGRSTCYISASQLLEFADALARFSLTLESEPVFEAGLSDGSKACHLHAYKISGAGHLAVYVRIATEQITPRPESIARSEIELPVEAWSLSQFAEELKKMATTEMGEAFLATCTAKQY